MRSNRQVKKSIFSGFGSMFRRVNSSARSLLNQKFTVMFIPHSEKKVINFQMSTLLLGFLVAMLLGMVGGFFYMTTLFTGSEQLMSEQQDDLVVTQANLDSVLDEVNDLVKMYEIFENTMNNTIWELNLPSGDGSASGRGGDLSSISDLQEINNGEVPEIYDLRRLRESLSDAILPLDSIAYTIQNEQQLLTDLPTAWPLSSGRSVVTMEFGPNIHPVHGNWYLHKGIDIAGPTGLPVLAAANGKVVEAGTNNLSGYGNYVLIEHKYGFRTRYSHLSQILVSAGETVAQGERIGLLGSSGLSTGPHLDFQIMLGTEVLDPASFLTIKNTFARWSNSTR
jgi:hypothetical protein